MDNIKQINIQDIARYIGLSMLSKGLSISPLKLQKILYYTQAWHMVFFGRENQLFNSIPQAWVNGPVYPDVYYRYKDMVPGMCDHLRPENFGVLENDDINETLKTLAEKISLSSEQFRLIESVINLYGSKTQNQLILYTHSELPWCEKREGLLPYEKSTKPISLDTMYSYYKERHDRNKARRQK